MKNLAKMILPVAALLLGGALSTTTASAATWHKGVPKPLRNRTYLMWKPNKNQYSGYVGYTFKNKNIYVAHSMDGGHLARHLKYKKTGAKSYYIKGHDSFSKDRLKVKLTSKKKIRVADLDNSLYKGYIPYKYHGKHFPSIH